MTGITALSRNAVYVVTSDWWGLLPGDRVCVAPGRSTEPDSDGEVQMSTVGTARDRLGDLDVWVPVTLLRRADEAAAGASRGASSISTDALCFALEACYPEVDLELVCRVANQLENNPLEDL